MNTSNIHKIIDKHKQNYFQLYRRHKLKNYQLDLQLYNDNAMSLKTFINGQTRPPYNRYYLGLVRNGHSTCGPISLYNANIILGNNQEYFSEILAYCSSFTRLNLFGYLGLNGKTIREYYNDKGYHVTTYYHSFTLSKYFKRSNNTYNKTSFSDIDNIIKQYPVCIILFPHGKTFLSGGHYVCVQYKDEAYHVYNLTNQSDSSFSFTSLTDYFKQLKDKNNTHIFRIYAISNKIV